MIVRRRRLARAPKRMQDPARILVQKTHGHFPFTEVFPPEYLPVSTARKNTTLRQGGVVHGLFVCWPNDLLSGGEGGEGLILGI